MYPLKEILVYKLMVLGFSLGLVTSTLAADFQTTKTLAEQGSASAQNEVADIYYDNASQYYSGVERLSLFKQAFDLYQKAADQGNAEAQYSLGYMYDYGNDSSFSI